VGNAESQPASSAFLPSTDGSSIQISSELQLIGTIFAALLGLAFGSFLNVFLTRFPEEESIVSPRSHCRNCDHTLAWWENLPVLSWIILRGRCRQCQHWIGLRYPLVELAVAFLWAAIWCKYNIFFTVDLAELQISHLYLHGCVALIGLAVLTWLLVALAALDAEHFWLPDVLTYPGIVLGFLYTLTSSQATFFQNNQITLTHAATSSLIAICASAGLVLIIRLLYWLIRREEGMGLGDAKLMAMLGAWLGLIGALESFAIAAVSATIASGVWLVVLSLRRRSGEWAQTPLPLGTFLCLAALLEIFNPNWLWIGLTRGFPGQ
jgi:leader peptidase (prepilin peptidase)/N-methyltransferase